MIIIFPQKPRVEISTELVRETRHHTAKGISTIRHDPPQRIFFLEYVESDGRGIVWDGATYLDALAAAQDWACDGVEIRDLTSETWGRA